MKSTIDGSARGGHPEPTPLPEILREVYRTGTVHGAMGEAVEVRDAVEEHEAEALYRTIRRLQPQRSLEVGLGQGVSTLAILTAMEENGFGEHHVVDPYQHAYDNVGLAMVARAGLGERLTFHRDFVESIGHGLGVLDFVFIDASHLFDLTLSAFVVADCQLRVGGVVGFHDLWLPSQQTVLRAIMGNRPYIVYEPESLGSRWLAPFWRRVLRRLPLAERVFRPDLLHPWREFRLPNLGLIEKTAHDNRPYDHFVGF